MRPIKFRAWNKEDKRFEYTEDQGFDRLASWLRSDLYEVEQYTGLLDKNGTDICDWDILKIEGEQKPILVEWQETIDSSGCETTWDLTVGYWIKNGLMPKEVIGNIHENPELLK